MCRIIYGCVSMDGEKISGPNDDPALEFIVGKGEEDDIEVKFQIPYKTSPVLTVTPLYRDNMRSTLSWNESPGSLIVLSTGSESFRVWTPSDSGAGRPTRFNFIAIG